jgi:hypothetical protein
MKTERGLSETFPAPPDFTVSLPRKKQSAVKYHLPFSILQVAAIVYGEVRASERWCEGRRTLLPLWGIELPISWLPSPYTDWNYLSS